MKAALIGFGSIAERSHVEALHSHGVEVVAVVEPAAQRQAAAQNCLPRATLYASLREFFSAAPAPDFVVICTPPHLHFEAAAAALRAGMHVLCEKPLVFLRQEAADLQRLAQSTQKVVGCVHNWTAAPIFVRIGELVRTGSLGALRSVELETLRTQPARPNAGTQGAAATAAPEENWRLDRSKSGGGILFDHGWHSVSIVLRAVDGLPTAVRGSVAREGHPYLQVEDTAHSWLTFDNGVQAHCMATWAAPLRTNRGRFVCERGEISLEDDSLTVQPADGPATTQKFADSLAGGGYRASWTADLLAEFLQEVAQPTRRGKLLNEAVCSLDILLATYESAARGSCWLPLRGREQSA
jgi:predicted dehydrogenase